MKKAHYSTDRYGRKVRRFDDGGDAGAGPGTGDDYYVTAPTTNEAPAVKTTTTAGLGSTGNTGYSAQEIADGLRAELGMRPGTTYWDMLQYGQQQYGLNPEQVQQAYQDTQGSVTPYNTPTAGGIYSAAPTAYQPVRYTPGYNDYGQGIASLFGRGYSQYFQPPGLTGNYFFGSPGGASTYVPPAGQGTQLPPGAQQQTIPGLTAEEQAQYNTLSPEQQAQYLQIMSLYKAPGNVQSDADLIAKYMAENNLSINEAAALTGYTPQEVKSYLGQAGLTDEQVARYQQLNATQQGTYADIMNLYNAPSNVQSDADSIAKYIAEKNLSINEAAALTGYTPQEVKSYLGQAGLTDEQVARYQQLNAPQQDKYSQLMTAYNSPGDTTSDVANVLSVMQENNLSAADVAALTGVPIDAVNAYLAQK